MGESSGIGHKSLMGLLGGTRYEPGRGFEMEEAQEEEEGDMVEEGGWRGARRGEKTGLSS